jgi:hypothetical protein
MAYSFVNSVVSAFNQTGTGISSLAAGAMTTTAANLIVVFAEYYYDLTADSGTFTVTDGTNSYAEITSAHVQNTTDKSAMRVFYGKNIAGGSVNPTINFPNSNFHFVDIAAGEYSGFDTAAPLVDGIGNWQLSSLGTGTDAVTSSNLNVTAQPAGVISVTYFDSSGDGPPLYGTGFTGRSTFWLSGGTAEGAWEDKRVTATGNTTGTFTKSASTGFTLTCAVAFAETGAGGGGTVVTPTVGALTATGNTPTVTPATSTVIQPIVARLNRKIFLPPRRGVLMPQRKLLLPARRRAA